jgi:hypothetical protein
MKCRAVIDDQSHLSYYLFVDAGVESEERRQWNDSIIELDPSVYDRWLRWMDEEEELKNIITEALAKRRKELIAEEDRLGFQSGFFHEDYEDSKPMDSDLDYLLFLADEEAQQ